LNKKGNDLAKIDKIDVAILSKNIINLNDKIKTMVDALNVKSSLNLEIQNI
jgi:hypothetical protein